ncbi:MAG: NAD(P)-dependent oxidoreductase [Rhodospirillaceae bacterium]|jgi:3-hydroxyisobutyrate dehydrogenase-like beta-hydroxyacid dehydrogenase|nr:NAD(P)-dependent oxidoreductase [Rhodospirillaceae bacterium]MBT6139862.1 NAD(P)-dependent oxidoreductase [Rhodospirillaceae bacterium]
MMRFAFIGFGEAGPLIAKGLIEAGAGPVSAYDILVEVGETRAGWIEKARSFGAMPAASPADAVADAEVVFSTVTSKEALVAAEAVAPHLQPGQFYLDLNSCSPGKKQAAAVAVEGSGAEYVDVAVMDTVPGRGHKVSMLLSGVAVERVIERLAPFDMKLDPVGDAVGQASTVKMARSVFVKGLEAILCESLTAAERVGVQDRVLDSIQGSFPGLDWRKLATYHMGRVVEHAKRRADEMESVAETLEELGVEPFTAAATGQRIRWVEELGIKDKFAGDLPRTLDGFLEAIRDADLKR